jgi:hypothetical protein
MCRRQIPCPEHALLTEKPILPMGDSRSGARRWSRQIPADVKEQDAAFNFFPMTRHPLGLPYFNGRAKPGNLKGNVRQDIENTDYKIIDERHRGRHMLTCAALQSINSDNFLYGQIA